VPVKIGLLTAYYNNYKPLANIVVPNLQGYCIKQGYGLYDYVLPQEGSHYSFKRLEMLKKIFSYHDIGVMLCTDIDILITNYNIKIESFLDDKHDFYICKDVNGINAGNFIVKNTEWSRTFIDFLLSKQGSFENDQCVIEAIHNNPEWKSKIKILPHPSINSFDMQYYAPSWGVIGDRKIERPTHKEGAWEAGDFVLHLPGMDLNKRIEILKEVEVWK
jgi:hypothetical protein